MSCLARAPKSTSVPSAAQLSATGSEKARLAAMNGSRRANSSGLSMNSVPANSGLPANAFWRRRRYPTPRDPWTKLTCGTGLRKLRTSVRMPFSAAYAQNWRVTWNCSLTRTALVMSIEPSGISGV
ncbi:Uncharacterised protein [Mycobacterium tuberculosis]|uniref:Uncharacterized protein n=1 Tax=Mycobacterium tuberculosis TaxID=1773 RepID=A0A655AJZ5_MYCTX|nr:Uncharacterised protein [Mycobacterium tuberculosis]